MKIPKYVDELLGYNTRSGIRVTNIHALTYDIPEDAIVGYVYRIKIQRGRWSEFFEGSVLRFMKWAERQGAETRLHNVVLSGWNTYAIVSVTDPVALALEKEGLVKA